MSTAILLSGQLRTFARCYPSQRWHVLRHFADPHFFFCVQRQPDAIDLIRPVMTDFGSDRVHLLQRDDPDLSAHLTPELSAAYHQAPYANAAPAHQLLLQHWYQAECWQFYTSHSTRPAAPYVFDQIIRLRPDLLFHSFDVGFQRAGATECRSPWWGRFGGINDRFALLGPDAARAYFTAFEHIPELLYHGCPFHPETLVAAALNRAGCTIDDTLRTEFSTLRTNGEQRWPEITSIDLAHAALARAA
jgi:hypothetical protein